MIVTAASKNLINPVTGAVIDGPVNLDTLPTAHMIALLRLVKSGDLIEYVPPQPKAPESKTEAKK